MDADLLVAALREMDDAANSDMMRCATSAFVRALPGAEGRMGEVLAAADRDDDGTDDDGMLRSIEASPVSPTFDNPEAVGVDNFDCFPTFNP